MKNLKLLRKECGLSQEKLAKCFEMSQQTIYKYESGLSEPDIANLIRLADYFNTSVDYLIGHTEIRTKIVTGEKYTLEPAEVRLIKGYRKLPEGFRFHVLGLIEEYFKR